jgi:hypothetical protein
MRLLVKVMSNEKLQVEALQILIELIKRGLLQVAVPIMDPPCNVSCNVTEAIISGSRSFSRREIAGDVLLGEMINKKGSLGIELLLGQQFRLSSNAEEEVKTALKDIGDPLGDVLQGRV